MLNKSDLSEDIEEAKDKECNVCSNAPINCVLQPCNHAVMCEDCAKRWVGENKSCPVCYLAIIRFQIDEAESHA